ncbi:MAG TPA: hypothetical protein VNO35_30380 [Steroidobacteraceae bacterium]|nr:hypothetical protein [Steroidobacteraceae bacterium]
MRPLFPDLAPAVSTNQRVAFESEDHLEYRWWTPQDIVDSCERFFPRTLPTVLSRMLQGEMIVEPLEVWPEI